MADHITYVDNSAVAANLVPAAWLNALNNLGYRGVWPYYAVSGGSANAQTLALAGTPSADFTTLTTGAVFIFKAGFTNTSTMTLAVTTSSAQAAAAVQWKGAALAGGEVFAAAPTAVMWDGTAFQLLSNAAIPTAYSLFPNFTTTATAAGTTTLTSASTYDQEFTGATTQTVKLPATSTLNTGAQYRITNSSTGLVTVQSNTAVTLLILNAGAVGTFSVRSTAADTAAAWTVNSTQMTRQTFLSGSAATYTTPAGCRRIVVRAKGGGGGGGGNADATNNGTAGGTGGTTIFNSINANGGSGGASNVASNAPQGGAGGTGGTGTASIRLAGTRGLNSTNMYASATNVYSVGGGGGGTGGGQGTLGGSTGTAAVANSGGGGGGAGNVSAAFAGASALAQGAGGGEGEYIEIVISAPAATYTYTVGAAGAAGTAGTNGFTGGAGGTGFIYVDEYY